MRDAMWAIGLMVMTALIALGCQSQQSITCDNGTTCAVGRVCAPAGHCVLPDQLTACVGKGDGDSCSLSLGEGFCEEGACVVGQCGNGRPDVGEVCDDGNTVSGDGCRSDCSKVEVCGDTEVDSGESCDDGNANAVDGCDACRAMRWSADALLGAPTSGVGLAYPEGVAVDRLGNVFIADASNHRIRRVDVQTGIITTAAGNGTQGSVGDGGPATSAQLAFPGSVAVDGLGNLFVVDTSNQRIRRVDAQTGFITTVAGNGTYGNEGDAGPATNAEFANPSGVAVDGLGNLFIADTYNHRIRRVDAQTGVITTAAGNGSNGGEGDGGLASSAELAYPGGVAVDGLGNLFIADRNNNRIRRVDAQTGVITTVAGNDTFGDEGDAGPATDAQMRFPIGVAVDGLGNLFIADSFNSRIRQVDAQTGIITTIAGTDTDGYAGDDGPATSAQLNNPTGVAVDGLGNLFVADRNNHRIRRVDAQTGLITTAAGSGTQGGAGDGGPATSAELNGPQGVVVDGLGNLFIADAFNRRILRVDAQTGFITTAAGNGTQGSSGDDGPATSAQLSYSYDVTLDGLGNLFIADRNNHRIRRVDAQTGVITTFAGGGIAGLGDDGPASSAQLALPTGVAVDGFGNLFIADRDNHRIRRVDAETGIITTVAGDGTEGSSGDDGLATSAQLDSPRGVAVDMDGNLFIADYDKQRIRHVNAQTGIITTVAGGGTSGLGDDGLAINAQIGSPQGVAVDGLGNLFIAGFSNNRIRRVDALTGIITTVAGTGTEGSAGDGASATSAQLANPGGVAVDGLGNLFIADSGNDRIRRVDAQTGVILSVAGAVFVAGMGLAPEARLVSAQAMATADGVSFFAGGSSGTVQAFEHGDATLESVIGRYPNASVATANLARYRADDFGDVGGVVYNASDKIVYLSESSNHRIHAVTIDDAGNGVVPDDPNTWTIDTLAGDAGIAGFADGIALSAEFREPQGLLFNEVTRQLYVADSGNHVIRAIDIDVGTVSTIAGTPRTLGYFGDGGDPLSALLYKPTAMTECPNGDLFIADTGSHHIRRVEAGTNTITTVIGVGIGASAGVGSPASTFPVDDPRGLACDDFGNLFVTSRSTIRLLPADDTGVVDGTGPVQTIYGAPPRDTFPASVTTCLTGIAVTVDDNGARVLQATDSCTGILVELTREL